MSRARLAVALARAAADSATRRSVLVPLSSPEDAGFVDAWCKVNGHSVLAVHGSTVEIVRGRWSDADVRLPPERMPGYRLWLYTNFHCNLSCEYCCAESSPSAPARALSATRVESLVREAAVLGTREIYLTGGEPFLNPDIAVIAEMCVAVAPTTLLTNGMLFRGSRLALLEAMPRTGLTLQISIDSPTPSRHDLARGLGSWERAVQGVRIARERGFHVRLAVTLAPGSPHEEASFDALCRELDVDHADVIVRRVAAEGKADEGVLITRATVLPEVCVTADAYCWHPVAVTNRDLRVADSTATLGEAVAIIREEFLEYQRRGDVLAASFPCA